MPLEQDIHSLGLLFEPQRRRVYDDVQSHPGRSVAEICDALNLGRSLVTFHLGKLIEAGFIEPAPAAHDAGFVGRPPQHYRTTTRTVSASVPDRQYELLASVLLEAVAEPTGRDRRPALIAAARRHGAALAGSLKTSVRRRGSRSVATALASVEALLTRLGYAPYRDRADGREALLVRNCPFESFRHTQTDQVCVVNHALTEGYLDGLDVADRLQSRLRPCPDNCCVVIEPVS